MKTSEQRKYTSSLHNLKFRYPQFNKYISNDIVKELSNMQSNIFGTMPRHNYLIVTNIQIGKLYQYERHLQR